MGIHHSTTSIATYAPAVIIVNAKSPCHTLPLKCPSSLSLSLNSFTLWLPCTHRNLTAYSLESQWFPFVYASCQRELCGSLLKRRTAGAGKFISNRGQKKNNKKTSFSPFLGKSHCTCSVLKQQHVNLISYKHSCGGTVGWILFGVVKVWGEKAQV